MPWQSLASPVTVTTAATPVQISTTPEIIYGILIQVLPTNTGKIAVGDDNTVRAGTVAGKVKGLLPPPTTNVYPALSGSVASSHGSFLLSDFWIDAAVSGEGVVVSYLTT